MIRNSSKLLGMTSGYKNAHSSDFFQKQAILDSASKLLSLGYDAVKDVGIPYLAAAPIVAGVGAGALHSKITSPSEVDAQTAEKILILEELDRLEKSLLRQRAQAEYEQEKEEQRGINERELRI